jgi:hypothetical protein
MQQGKAGKTTALQHFHELIGPEKVEPVEVALIAKGVKTWHISTLNRLCAPLEGDAYALADPAAKALFEVLAVIERKTEGRSSSDEWQQKYRGL